MAGSPGQDPSLDGYRERADRFLAELEEEAYLHFAGLKPELELGPIHERYLDLTSLEQARRIGERVADDGRMRELWSQGQRLSADELLRELDGSRLDLATLAAELREALEPA
jgi:hypothetical protein